MTRKDYELIARVFAYQMDTHDKPINEDIRDAITTMAKRMARELLAASKYDGNGNKSFKTDRFLAACGVTA